jgi:mRNA interferase MazF
MRSGMIYKQRDIILIPIPFTDLSSKKKRPVIIVSNDDYNQNNFDIVVVALTSNLNFKNKYCIGIDSNNLESGKLPQISQIRCDKIYSLSTTIIAKKFDRINISTYTLIKNKIEELFNENE